MLKSNNCAAIHLTDITAAESFYTNVIKFKLLSRSDAYLEYDTGHFLLYVNRDLNTQPPIQSFTVKTSKRQSCPYWKTDAQSCANTRLLSTFATRSALLTTSFKANKKRI
jgi:hypothetical protein